MLNKRIRNIIKKEWEVLFKNLDHALFVTVLPLIIVAQLLLILYLIDRYASDETLLPLLENRVFKRAIDSFEDTTLSNAGKFTLVEKLLILIINQVPFYFMFIPTMIAVSFATFSIVEEKITNTLEPLLATPITTEELLLGKALSGMIPAVILSWIDSMIFLVVLGTTTLHQLLQAISIRMWLVSMLLMMPAVGLLSFLLGVLSSSRARDAKSAQNVALIVIFPVIGMMVLQLTGIFKFNSFIVLLLSIGIFILDFVILRVVSRMFRRETILIKWR